jgi:5-methylcytosine-specific restriction endonuclease McrA
MVPGAEAFGDVSGVVLAHLLAPALASLSAVPDGLAGDAQLVDLAVGLGRLEAWAVAQRASVLALLEHRTYQELVEHGMVEPGDSRGSTAWASHRFDDIRLTERIVSTEVSLALGVTPWAADRERDLAANLTLHPRLADALARGRIDRRRCELLLDEIAVLETDEQRAQVVSAVVGDGTHACDHPDLAARPPDFAGALIRPLRHSGRRLIELQPRELRRAVRQRVDAIDAEAAARRESVARAARRVERRPLPASMAEIRIAGPAAEVGAAFATVDERARAMRTAGDVRDLDQLRCDVAIGQLSDGLFGVAPDSRGPRPGPGVLAVITMTDRTALGLDDNPATLHGAGAAESLPAEVARQIAYDPGQSTWRALYRHPGTGIATDISRRYRPPERMRAFVRLRDGLRSRLPIEGGAITEIDHVVPYDHEHPERGGTTTPSGLETLGRRGHHLKTDGVLTVTGDANGALTFRTRTGHEYMSWPEDWGEEPGEGEVAGELREPRGHATLRLTG